MGGNRGPAARRGAGDAGAGTVEYAGLVVAICVVLAGLAFTPIAARTAAATSHAFCQVFSQVDCATGTADPSRTPYEQATSGQYVAMGDSFSSGEGAGDYDEPTDRDDRDFADWMDSHLWWPGDREPQYHNGCHRSANAYGSIVAAENDFAGGASFVACSGAEIHEFTDPNSGQSGEQAQEDGLDDDTSLVTFSIGGNDLGFADVLADCVLNGYTCQDENEADFQQGLLDTRARLIETYRRIHEKAPNARIVVVGYPRLFPAEPSDNFRDLLFADSQVWMNQKADQLDAMLAGAAREAGVGVEFVDPREAFEGHGLGSTDPWFNDLSLQANGFSPVNPGSFHPNAQGQRALADLVQEQLHHPHR
jgi:lysophospholipase L1-like esterase